MTVHSNAGNWINDFVSDVPGGVRMRHDAERLLTDLYVWMDEHDCATVGELREVVEPVIDVEFDYFGTEDQGNG